MPTRTRLVFKGGEVVAEYHDGDLVWAKDYEPPADAGPLVVGDLPGYVSPVTGKWIEGRAARREDLKRTSSRPYEGREQEAKESARQRAYAQQAAEHRVERQVWSTWNNLPRAVQRHLMGEK
jgi:hypothetical protein